MAFTGTTNATSGTVQFYQCVLNAASTVSSDCSATETGTYAIETVSGVQIMRFTGYAPATFSTKEDIYEEVKGTPTGDCVVRARQAKPAAAFKATTDNGVNNTAWAALKSQPSLPQQCQKITTQRDQVTHTVW